MGTLATELARMQVVKRPTKNLSANDRISLSTPTEARDRERRVRACVRAYARERAGSGFCFGGFGLPAAGLWSSGFYGLHDGIYLKRPAAVIRLLWTFVTPTRASDRVRKTTHRRARVGFRKLSLSAHREIVKIARHRVDCFWFYTRQKFVRQTFQLFHFWKNFDKR